MSALNLPAGLKMPPNPPTAPPKQIATSPVPEKYAHIPAEMRASKSWLVWRKQSGNGQKINKIPHTVDGRPANDPKLGVSFDEAVTAEIAGKFDGIGFYVEPAPQGAGFVCVDIDGCVNTKTREINEDAVKIASDLNSFSELSVSGTGIHVWVKGEKPGPACRKGNLEIYSTGRFVALGSRLEGVPNSIEERSEQLRAVYDRLLKVESPDPSKSDAPPTASQPTSKASVQVESVGSVITTKEELFVTGKIVSTKPFRVEDQFGNSVEFPSQSEADLSFATILAFKFQGDAQQIDEAFRQSILFREKWARKDYSSGTIATALKSYEKSKTDIAPKPAEPTTADGLNWRSQFRSVGQLETGGIKMLIDGFLPEGINMLGALPGNCKTLFSLSIAKALTTGKSFLDRFKVSTITPVLYLIPESSGAAFRQRAEKFGIPDNPDLFLCRTVSQGSTLLMDDPSIRAAVQYLKPLVFLDTAIRFNKSTDENSASANKLFVDDAISLIASGARGILGVHHSTKSSRKEGLTLESALRGTGDLAAMADSVYGLKRNDALYGDGNGPLELQVLCLKSRDFEPPMPFTIAATAKEQETTISHIDTKGDFVALETADLLHDLDDRFVKAVTAEPDLTLAEVAELLGVTVPRVQRVAKKIGYRKSKGGEWRLSSLRIGVSDDPDAGKDVEV